MYTLFLALHHDAQANLIKNRNTSLPGATLCCE